METTDISFTTEEKTIITEITHSYSELYKETIKLQDDINIATEKLNNMIQLMDRVKQSEIEFFTNLSDKYDLDPKTIANFAANYILSKTK